MTPYCRICWPSTPRSRRRLADPAVHADQNAARKLGRRFAELAPVVAPRTNSTPPATTSPPPRELAAEDASFAAEATALTARIGELEARLQELLLPKDPTTARTSSSRSRPARAATSPRCSPATCCGCTCASPNARAGPPKCSTSEPTDLGGIKSATVAVRGRKAEDAPWAKLKYEGGVHRVQRVPATESQGRIHTSAAGVLVMPEAEDVEIDIDPNDLRIDVFRSSGPGGQSVNTTDSAVRITHVPTGTVVSMQNEKSQLQNREAGMRVLRARLLQAAQDEADAAAAESRRSQVRTVDRSERVRTYNFPENRISDHRVGFKAYNLDQVLDGALDDVIEALTRADVEALLAGSAG